MPKVEKVVPEGTPETSASTDSGNDEFMEMVVTQLEDLKTKMASLPGVFRGLTEQLTTLDSRLEEVEKTAVDFEKSASPVMPEKVYKDLTVAHVFSSALTGAITQFIATYPVQMSGKPEIRAQHVRNAVDIAFTAVETAMQRLPNLK